MTARPALAAAGDLDTSFSGDGKVRTDFSSRGEIANSVAIQGDGKIVVAGASGIGGSNPKFAMARYEVDGSRDRSFSGDGKLVTDFTAGFDAANAVAIQADGKIVAAGESGDGGPNPTFALVRYNANGSLDTTFSGDGEVTTDFTSHADYANGLAIQVDGRILAAGESGEGGLKPKVALARYLAA